MATGASPASMTEPLVPVVPVLQPPLSPAQALQWPNADPLRRRADSDTELIPSRRFNRFQDQNSFLRWLAGARPKRCLCFPRTIGLLTMIGLTVALQVSFIVVITLQTPQLDIGESRRAPTSTLMICAFVLLAQTVLLLLGVSTLLHRVWEAKIAEAFAVYFTMIFTFASIYILAFEASVDGRAFEHVKELKSFSGHGGTSLTMLELLVAFFYVSTMTQAGVGFGDIYPVSVVTTVMCAVQMLLGVVFNIYIISQTLTLLRVAREHQNLFALRPRSRGRCSAFMKSLTSNSVLRVIRRTFRRYMLLFTVLVELMMVLLLYIPNKHTLFNLDVRAIRFVEVAVAVQLLLALVMLSSASKYTRYTEQVTVLVLVQAYTSIICVFSGVYTLMYFLGHERSFSIPKALFTRRGGSGHNSATLVWDLMYSMLYFSCTTMTTVGYGDIVPIAWYTRLAVSVQALVAVFMHVVVLGLGLDRLATRRFDTLTEKLLAGDVEAGSRPPSRAQSRAQSRPPSRMASRNQMGTAGEASRPSVLSVINSNSSRGRVSAASPLLPPQTSPSPSSPPSPTWLVASRRSPRGV